MAPDRRKAMLVDESKCVGCGNCVPVCTMGVISIQNGLAQINQEECVECSTCYRVLVREDRPPWLVRTIRGVLRAFRLSYDAPFGVCPTGALVKPELTWPRMVRRAFSDVLEPHASTGIPGRGTEEIKTNDVTGRLQEGDAGFVVELGRPGIGARFRDIEKFSTALAALGAEFEAKNPVTSLMTDPKTGKIQEEILNEKVMSAIIEFKVPLEKVSAILSRIQELGREIDTVACVGIGAKCDNGCVPYEEAVRAGGFTLSVNGKTNLGLGRAVLKEAAR